MEVVVGFADLLQLSQMDLILVLTHLQFERLSSITHHLRKNNYRTELTNLISTDSRKLTSLSLTTIL